MPQQKIRIEIPDHFKPADREAIAKDIVEFIRERSEDGVGVRRRGSGFVNAQFPAYSTSYKESLDFKIAGKSSHVDLTLSGDMLIALDVLSHKRGSVVVGYAAGSEENARAEGNILGSYGGSPNPRKARNFLGITDADLRSIIARHE
ncbi:MAG TPA: hypothetical protein VGP38_01455, partial [Rubrobacter sp.]|nr:hypothetical protein [Rubrobacter sp.]